MPLRHSAYAALVGALVIALAPCAHAQITFNEPGFSAVQLTGDFAKQIELGIGPDSCIYHGGLNGLVRFCPPSNTETVCDPNVAFPVGIAFSSSGAFGSFMYVADYSNGNITRSSGCTAGTLFATITDAGSLAFPPSGSAYGTFLYSCTAFSGPIYRVSSTGVVTSWSPLATSYLRFGPGGVWGNGLFATDYTTPGSSGISKISSTGVVTPVTGGLLFPEGFDWGFDGDLFVTDPIAGGIMRVKSNGTSSIFATLAGAADVAYRPSEGALYVVSNQGGLYRIKKGATTGVDSAPAVLATPRISPNPARGACTLEFAQPRGGIVRVSVFDAQGRIVRRLPESWRPAGANSLAWDGRDDEGAAVNAGAYFVRVRGEGGTQNARVTIAR